MRLRLVNPANPLVTIVNVARAKALFRALDGVAERMGSDGGGSQSC